jgi:hypothetical protein
VVSGLGKRALIIDNEGTQIIFTASLDDPVFKMFLVVADVGIKLRIGY